MFTADRAPDWADGECCHRCRSQFTMIRRKVNILSMLVYNLSFNLIGFLFITNVKIYYF